MRAAISTTPNCGDPGTVRGGEQRHASSYKKVNASVTIAPGPGNQEMYASHLLLEEDANRSMSNGPKVLATRPKASSDKDHSVSGSTVRDSRTARMLRLRRQSNFLKIKYRWQIKKCSRPRSSYQRQICLKGSEK